MNTIEINGKQYPCHMTMGAMVRFKNDTGKDVSEMGNDTVSATRLIYHMIAAASNAKGVPFEMSFEDFADNITPDQLAAMMPNEEAKPGKKK